MLRCWIKMILTSSPPFRAGIPTVVLQLLRWVRVADRITARFTWHALLASPALIKVYDWRRLSVSRQPCLGCNQVHICLCQVVICMAERAGLEPATHGIKIRCTTFVLPLNCFGGGGWSRTNNVYLSEQIYSLPQHHRRCRPSKLFGQ